VEALTDGVLAMRRLFGFTGPNLVEGAIDVLHCQRCDALAIEGHLASVATQLDIDGDGDVEPLTDGLLVLRWLFGFRGDALISGAVDTLHCTRCTADAIEGYLSGAV
jgi:hypothetical protein